jgi:hypothetical protein
MAKLGAPPRSVCPLPLDPNQSVNKLDVLEPTSVCGTDKAAALPKRPFALSEYRFEDFERVLDVAIEDLNRTGVLSLVEGLDDCRLSPLWVVDRT